MVLSPEVVNAAKAKGWQVIGLALKESASFATFWTVVAKRENPVFADRPYMTITARDENNEVSFHSGHYDLTKEQAFETIGFKQVA